MENRKTTVEPGQHLKTLSRMENDIFPWLGNRPITEITAQEILSVLKRIDARGARYTTHRVRSEISRAFRFAVATGRTAHTPCPDLKGAIAPAKFENFAAITDPKEAAELLRELEPLTGRCRHVLPVHDPQKCMSHAAVNAALRRMGYDTKTKITGHGFRAMARTILAEELHIAPEVIERQLAHKVPDALGTTHNRTKFLKKRRVMMLQWADNLEQLKKGLRCCRLQTVYGES